MKEPKEIKNPMHCLSCDYEITVIYDLQNEQPVKKNNIVICYNCAALHKVGDSSLVKLERKDFAKLDDQSKHLIAMTVTSILKKNAKEKK